MKGAAVMVQGTSSGVGKSLIAMALCRHFAKKGLKVAPFKSQNMSLNSAVSVEGGEMSRAQYVQAIACGVSPSVRMNPILLKPDGNRTQVIVRGVVRSTVSAKDYMNGTKNELLDIALKELESLMEENDVVVVEGAGSPVEMNLKARDISNMKVAKAFGIPVVLAADIEKGGSFAQIVGTMELLDPDERDLVVGYILNKFRGDPSLLGDYPEELAGRYSFDFFGTMPYTGHRIPEEDSMVSWEGSDGDVSVDVVRFPHISNFDDFDPLLWNSGVGFKESGPLDGDVVILPGTKSTVSDLLWMKETGLADEILRARERGSVIVGICGGYQMLGEEVEEDGKRARGLGLLPVKTRFDPLKTVSGLKGTASFGGRTFGIEGYEIHRGVTEGIVTPFARVTESNRQKADRPDGAVGEGVIGTYFHGLFGNLGFTEAFLNSVRAGKGLAEKKIEDWPIFGEIDGFTEFFEKNVDVAKIERKMGL